MISSSWDDRIERAADLAQDYSFARDLLNFYREIALFQKPIYENFSEAVGEENLDVEGTCPLHDGSLYIHMPRLLTFFPSFLSLITKVGPPPLAQLAQKLSADTERPGWASLLESYWRKELNPEAYAEGLTVLFFPKAFLQPYAEFLADNHNKDFMSYHEEVTPGHRAQCPLCDSPPQLSILRTEADGAKRSLLCSLCATEWRYKRVCCPACGEDRYEHLPYHKAPDFPHVRVESCETCHAYIKGIDLTVTGLAVPVVDEIAAIPLDLWAAEQGYRKIEMNLIGV